jgi:DNA-directed RNA polymerase beta' subunit
VGGLLEQAPKNVLQSSRSKSIDFSVLSPDNILQISKAEVSTHELYAGPLAPVACGPLDLRMGVGTKLLRCGTCGEGL